MRSSRRAGPPTRLTAVATPDHASDPIDFGRSVFLCSKPLQVLNCASITRHFGIDDARLHVLSSAIDDADGFRSFLAGTGYPQLFSSISWNRDVHEAIGELAARRYDSLFVEDDRLGSYLLLAPLRTARLAVFEEGIGTYRMSAERELRGLRRLKWKLIAARRGAGWTFGSGRRTDHVLVSRPRAYARLNPRLAHKALGFPGVIDELRHEADAWREVVLPALGRPGSHLGRVALVLATWGGAPGDVLARAADGADVVYYKAHPHDGARPAGGSDTVVEVAGSWIPAEAVIEILAGRCDQLTVYHHSSSAAFYAHGVYAGVDHVDLVGSDQLRDVLAALG